MQDRRRIEAEWKQERANFDEASRQHSRLLQAQKLTASFAKSMTKAADDTQGSVPLLRRAMEGQYDNCTELKGEADRAKAAEAKAKDEAAKAKAKLDSLTKKVDAASDASAKSAAQGERVLALNLYGAAAGKLGNATMKAQSLAADIVMACEAAQTANNTHSRAVVVGGAKAEGAADLGELNKMRADAVAAAKAAMDHARDMMNSLVAQAKALMKKSDQKKSLRAAGKKTCPLRTPVSVPPRDPLPSPAAQLQRQVKIAAAVAAAKTKKVAKI